MLHIQYLSYKLYRSGAESLWYTQRSNRLGKTRRGHKEFSREKRLIYENQRLKRAISSLRKQLARVDVDRYTQIKDIIEEHYAQEDEADRGQNILEKLKKEWSCRECGEGFLKIHIINRLDGVFYYRKCTDCKNRTNVQPYDSSVKGIIDEPKEE